MTDLSPAAQAVLDVYWETFNAPLEGAIHRPLAAAIRELADQVVSKRTAFFSPGTVAGIRAELFAIATELEALPND